VIFLEAIILAAGYSSRFPEYKLVQKINNKTLLEHTIHQMSDFVTNIYVVTGHHHERIESILSQYRQVKCIYNDEFDNGMFSSVKKGVSCVNESFFLIPGDCPFVSKATYKLLLESNGDILIPSYQMHGGHPIKISITHKKALINSKLSNLREFLDLYNKTYITVSDPWILEDIDDKETFNRIKGRLENENNRSY